MESDNFKTLLDWVMREEQFSATVFWDVDDWSVGFGRHGAAQGVTENTAVTLETARQWCVEDLIVRYKGCAELLGEAAWQALSPIRQGCLAAMAYQMGVGGVEKFVNTLQAIKEGDWELAFSNLLQSRWAQQTPARARRTATAMLNDKWPDPNTLPPITWEDN